jgi:hypothetical protein
MRQPEQQDFLQGAHYSLAVREVSLLSTCDMRKKEGFRVNPN